MGCLCRARSWINDPCVSQLCSLHDSASGIAWEQNWRHHGCLGRAQMGNRSKSLILGKLQLQVKGTVRRVRWLEELRPPLEQQEQSGLGAKIGIPKQFGKSSSPGWAPVSSPSGNQISTNSLSQPDVCYSAGIRTAASSGLQLCCSWLPRAETVQ